MAPVRKEERSCNGFSFLEQVNFCRGDLIKGLRDAGFGLDGDRTIGTIVDLTAAVSVVKVATILVGVPFVLERLSRLDWSLCESRDTVSPGCVCLVDACRRQLITLPSIRVKQTMVMDARIERHVVHDFNLHPIILLYLQQWTRILPIDKDHIPYIAIWGPLSKGQLELEVALASKCNSCK